MISGPSRKSSGAPRMFLKIIVCMWSFIIRINFPPEIDETKNRFFIEPIGDRILYTFPIWSRLYEFPGGDMVDGLPPAFSTGCGGEPVWTAEMTCKVYLVSDISL